MLAEYRRRRDLSFSVCRSIPGVTCAEPKGAFYAYPNIGAALRKKGHSNTLQFSERLLAESHVRLAG